MQLCRASIQLISALVRMTATILFYMYTNMHAQGFSHTMQNLAMSTARKAAAIIPINALY